MSLHACFKFDLGESVIVPDHGARGRVTARMESWESREPVYEVTVRRGGAKRVEGWYTAGELRRDGEAP